MAVGALCEWELIVVQGGVWEAAAEYGGPRRRLAVGTAREWECIVGQRGVWEAVMEYGGARRRLAVGALCEWEWVVVIAPCGKMRVSCVSTQRDAWG